MLLPLSFGTMALVENRAIFVQVADLECYEYWLLTESAGAGSTLPWRLPGGGVRPRKPAPLGGWAVFDDYDPDRDGWW